LPLLNACLQNVRVITDCKFPEPEENPALHTKLSEDGRQCALVYPGEDAVLSSEFRKSASSSEKSPPQLSLIFLDARWSQTLGMFKNSTWLQQIPRIALAPTEHSGYMFRQQPHERCVSTLEAVGLALADLEDDGHFVREGLQAFFTAFVKSQINFIPRIIDKNAPGGREVSRKATGEVQLSRIPDRSVLPATCLCSWGAYNGIHRQIHVVQILYGMTPYEVEEERRKISNVRKGGQRLFPKKCCLIPDDAVFEC